MKKILTLALTLSLALLCSACLVGRFAWYNFSGITDYKIFPSRPLPASSSPFRFVNAQRDVQKNIGKVRLKKIDSLANLDKTVAILIIRNDSLLFEKYYHDYQANSLVASFSMAKSYTSALIGEALADGYLKSVDEPITNYIPELKKSKGFEKVKITHLLQMTSGIKANESYYNPLGQAAKLYYGRTLRNYLTHLKTDYEPGTKFAYRSVNTQLLGLILDRATGKHVTDYLNEKIWKHVGSEFDASWSIDKKNNGLEKTFCCLNASARDFAKFGRLFLNKGNWNGQQLLSADWVAQSTTPTREDGGVPYYKYQWWIAKHGFYADGLHGQYIYVCPGKNLIIVRLGIDEKKVSWPQMFDAIAERI